jgi:hypothetical protein
VTRRWAAGQVLQVQGYTFRVVPGSKAADDLRLEELTREGWRPVPMAVAFVLVDFLAENEDALTPHRPWWTTPGGDWFMGEVWRARYQGWAEAQRRIEEARR